MLQDVESTNSPSVLEDMSPFECTKERSIHLSINSDLPKCLQTKKISPVIKILRSLCLSQQILPSYSSFILMVNVPPKSLTKIVYYPVIKESITEYSTVQDVLRCLDEASNEVGQSIVVTTFDLVV